MTFEIWVSQNDVAEQFNLVLCDPESLCV